MDEVTALRAEIETLKRQLEEGKQYENMLYDRCQLLHKNAWDQMKRAERAEKQISELCPPPPPHPRQSESEEGSHD